MLLELNSRIVMDTLGDEVLVLDGDNGVVHRLTGPIAAYALSLQNGAADVNDDEYAQALITARIAVEVAEGNGQGGTVSRRTALVAMVGVSAGAATLLLPSGADAASVDGGAGVTTTTAELPQYPDVGWDARINTMFNQGPPDTRELKLRWGQSYPTSSTVTSPVPFTWTVEGPDGSGIYYSGTAITGLVDFFQIVGWVKPQQLTVTLVSIPPTGYSSRTIVKIADAP